MSKQFSSSIRGHKLGKLLLLRLNQNGALELYVTHKLRWIYRRGWKIPCRYSRDIGFVDTEAPEYMQARKTDQGCDSLHDRVVFRAKDRPRDLGFKTKYPSSRRPRYRLRASSDHIVNHSLKGYKVFASAGGLVVFGDMHCNRQSLLPTFIVANPLTRQYHKLPTLYGDLQQTHNSLSCNFRALDHMLCGIDVDLGTGHYTFIVVDTHDEEIYEDFMSVDTHMVGGEELYDEHQVYVYDSRFHSWRSHQKLPEFVRGTNIFIEEGPDCDEHNIPCVTKEGKFHWIVTRMLEGYPQQFLYIYDVKLDVWNFVPCEHNPLSDYDLIYRCVEHKGQVVVLAFNPSLGRIHRYQVEHTGIMTENFSPFGQRTFQLREAEPMPSMYDDNEFTSYIDRDGYYGFHEDWRRIEIRGFVGAGDEVIYFLRDYYLTKQIWRTPMLRYSGVDKSWKWMSKWVPAKYDNYPLWPRLIWTFLPSLVSPG
ncbi:hypothetical protein MPTK1_1g14270 [Marchantia polymorpha subsp. ruderalis]|nr:hypothetical protein MARPO_0179s0008 [Marchantia polymorpha]PTQ27919.1 hypothetical protein MARPO_0179s0008 [Marchantia polymorpha]BBM98537.1 hypothetical protein Mp_1g14270 [Marchantia polymorpha subsp. ruderalis]BBM98538.1 hypothetical protein Mp_1g14270 [Marchantia polymorpha subsp. ruderalis]|eukprot:PTQ27918.1 hypothetical protein MARPO_0179s0008 [Marchantia polymorpha]